MKIKLCIFCSRIYIVFAERMKIGKEVERKYIKNNIHKQNYNLIIIFK